MRHIQCRALFFSMICTLSVIVLFSGVSYGVQKTYVKPSTVDATVKVDPGLQKYFDEKINEVNSKVVSNEYKTIIKEPLSDLEQLNMLKELNALFDKIKVDKTWTLPSKKKLISDRYNSLLSDLVQVHKNKAIADEKNAFIDYKNKVIAQANGSRLTSGDKTKVIGELNDKFKDLAGNLILKSPEKNAELDKVLSNFKKDHSGILSETRFAAGTDSCPKEQKSGCSGSQVFNLNACFQADTINFKVSNQCPGSSTGSYRVFDMESTFVSAPFNAGQSFAVSLPAGLCLKTIAVKFIGASIGSKFFNNGQCTFSAQ